MKSVADVVRNRKILVAVVEGRTLAEVAEEHGVSLSRIRQVWLREMTKLKNRVGEGAPEVNNVFDLRRHREFWLRHI